MLIGNTCGLLEKNAYWQRIWSVPSKETVLIERKQKWTLRKQSLLKTNETSKETVLIENKNGH